MRPTPSRQRRRFALDPAFDGFDSDAVLCARFFFPDADRIRAEIRVSFIAHMGIRCKAGDYCINIVCVLCSEDRPIVLGRSRLMGATPASLRVARVHTN